MWVNIAMGMIFRALPVGAVKDSATVFQKDVTKSAAAQAALKTAYPQLKSAAQQVKARTATAQGALTAFLVGVPFEGPPAASRDGLVRALATSDPRVEKALHGALGFIK